MGKSISLTKNQKTKSKMTIHKNIMGYLFAAPWIIGFFVFTLYPVSSSLYYSFTNYNTLQDPVWIGLRNYIVMFTKDTRFWTGLWNTLYYAALSVPLGIAGGVLIAVLLNQKVKGMRFFRTIFYLPTVVSSVAVALLWMWILEPNFGLLNTFLAKINIIGPGWLTDPAWSKNSLILMSLWSVGGGMLIYLAALQDVPQSLYESATIDGAGALRKFFKITLPMITPTLFFNLITGVIGGLQVFQQAFIMTNGGPSYSTYFYAYHLYNKAFTEYQMGFASSMAWVLLVVTLMLSLVIMRTSNKWVYYEGE
ncbi:sugar ABC transporter permease [Lachnospiraceae bacterium OttesenSCG-928-D06]|nr:sugar ABC transporter permease [Lachnospiraceae bacterium OttesenSCG-928-D06]